jgi:hypothetical protein
VICYELNLLAARDRPMTPQHSATFVKWCSPRCKRTSSFDREEECPAAFGGSYSADPDAPRRLSLLYRHPRVEPCEPSHAELRSDSSLIGDAEP